MGVIDALFGPKMHRMSLEELRDHLYDVQTMMKTSKSRMEKLEREMDKKYDEAIDVQGSMFDVFVQELTGLEGEIQLESLLFSMFNLENNNVKEMVQIKEANERLGKVKLISVDPRYKVLVRQTNEGRKAIQAQIDALKKAQEIMRRGRLGGSIGMDNPEAERCATLISQMQNARAKGMNQDEQKAKEEFRNMVKGLYTTRTSGI
jgi:hypothetical protein